LYYYIYSSATRETTTSEPAQNVLELVFLVLESTGRRGFNQSVVVVVVVVVCSKNPLSLTAASYISSLAPTLRRRATPMGEANATGGAPPAAAPAVRVLSVSRVAPADRAAAADGDDPAMVVKLSFFDTPWVVLPPIQRVFLYSLPGGGDDADGHEFTDAVATLKTSLAATLAVYLPLAGKLAYDAGTGDVVVDCAAADDLGVAFVEAEADADDETTFDVRHLADDEAHDIPAFLALVPDLPTKVLPAPVLSVQATRLPRGGGGGLALGLSVHHAVADGQAVWRFMAAWVSAAREGSPVTKSLPAPHFGREVIHVPNGDESARHMLKMIAPNLPVVRTYATKLATFFFVCARFLCVVLSVVTDSLTGPLCVCTVHACRPAPWPTTTSASASVWRAGRSTSPATTSGR